MAILHLATRFARSLRAKPLDEGALRWIQSQLSEHEWQLWRRTSHADQRHTYAVARHVNRQLPHASTSVFAAALLHDIGKLTVLVRGKPLGTFGRVLATVLWLLHIRPRVVREYHDHPSRGAELLRGAKSDDFIVSWAAEHELPESQWTIPREFGRVLREADDG